MNKKQKIPKNVFALGWVSLLMDLSSEMIFPILPIFMTNVLGISKALIGIIEGIAESTASILKVFSGYISDKVKKRKLLIITGYSLSALFKPVFAIANNAAEVFIARFGDRLGKGIRDAPRDALIAESIKKKSRGEWFGFHRMMDTSGAVLGTITAALLLKYITTNYRIIFWLATIPAIIAILVIIFFVDDVKHKVSKKVKLSIRGFSEDYKLFLTAATIFTLGNFSYAFYILRAQSVGVAIALIPIIYLLYNIIYAAAAMPAGILSDKIGRKKVIAAGYLLLALASFIFAFTNSQIVAWIVFAIYGLQIAMVNGNSRAFVADLAPANRKGTALGAYQTITGIALLPASFIAGYLWDSFGPTATFLAASIFALIATKILLLIKK